MATYLAQWVPVKAPRRRGEGYSWYTFLNSKEVMRMAGGKKANKQRLTWRSKKANHGVKPNHGK
jgi:hypothetical protein